MVLVHEYLLFSTLYSGIYRLTIEVGEDEVAVWLENMRTHNEIGFTKEGNEEQALIDTDIIYMITDNDEVIEKVLDEIKDVIENSHVIFEHHYTFKPKEIKI